MKTPGAGYLALLLATALCFSSCAATTARRVPFHEADFAAYRGPGTATVTGKLAVSTKDGLREGNRVSVELVPVTPYTEEMVEVELSQGLLLSPPIDPRFKEYARITTTDYHGNFAIHQVPAGHYFICGEVDWLPPAATDYAAQWGLERITVGQRQTFNVTLAHNPNYGRIIPTIETLR